MRLHVKAGLLAIDAQLIGAGGGNTRDFDDGAFLVRPRRGVGPQGLGFAHTFAVGRVFDGHLLGFRALDDCDFGLLRIKCNLIDSDAFALGCQRDGRQGCNGEC